MTRAVVDIISITGVDGVGGDVLVLKEVEHTENNFKVFWLPASSIDGAMQLSVELNTSDGLTESEATGRGDS